MRTSRDILFIAPSAYPLGGVASWLDYIVPGLRDRDWNVTLGLVEGRFHDVDAYLDAHPDGQVLRIPCGTGTPEGRVRQLLRAVRNVRPHIVVAVNIVDVAPAIERIRVTSEWSPRLAISLHAVQADLIGSVQRCEGVIDAVVCTNRLTCDLVAKLTSVVPCRIHYAPCGVNVNKVTPKERRASDGILKIAYVGRLERAQKRIEDIGAIAAELDRRGIDYELVIAGGGPDEEWLRVRLSDATSCARVRFLGALASVDLPEQVYSRADALLIMSPCETGPIVAWEAMANGVAVVTSAYIGSGLEGSLEPGENCLMFPVGDAAAAAECLERLRDQELRRRLLQGGFNLVARRYSMTVSIENWSATLEKITAKAPLSPPSPLLAHMMRMPSAGRLDRLFGTQVGETIRELLGFKYDHCEPGGEWPHTRHCSALAEEAFWQLAMSIDRNSRRPVDSDAAQRVIAIPRS